jgi:aspartyl-tRNA(Asn)/glutamyl-tRNA(Gln) amidotransferase subunit B
MEKGVIRFEANVSIRPSGSQTLGTRTEIKNLNSFRALSDGIAYEVERQTAVLDAGEEVVQDTMGWSESRQQTFSQRGKEEAHDYRYFPEPDLPPIQVGESWIDAVRAALPELPESKQRRYETDFGLTAYEAGVLVEDRPVAEWFDTAVAAGGDPRTVSNWLINVLFSLMNEYKQSIADIKVTPESLVELITLVDKTVINNNTAKEVLGEMFQSGRAAKEIVEAKGLAQISDESLLEETIAQILADNPEQVAIYLGGKDGLQGWFVGQVMRATRGKANPAVVNRLLENQLDHLRNLAAED